MKNLKLSSKILIVSIIVLLIFSVASFGILYRALSKQAIREMDQILKNETLALSVLANSVGNGKFDFEMPPSFLNQFQQRNPNGFFRFVDPETGTQLRESNEAPQIACGSKTQNENVNANGRNFRVETFLFKPELDRETDEYEQPEIRSLCLVVGIDQKPYQHVLTETLFSSIPILIFIVIVLVAILLVLIRRLTRDLLALCSALTTTNFSATHAFPALPKAATNEVKAIIEVLAVLHEQAAEVYREMWLFMGRAAHQIKTPVTAMQATIEVLLRKERTREELLVGLEDVKVAASLLDGLTRKLMSSSRIAYEARPALEPIELGPFLKEMVEMFRSKADMSGVHIVFESVDHLSVLGNRTLMTDIFGNLIENAILYSPEHKNAHVSILWSAVGEKAAIEISDQGMGFPNNVQAELFKPFFRGDERQTFGTGLGLSIAKKSALLMGGDVELAESDERGSKIRVWLGLP